MAGPIAIYPKPPGPYLSTVDDLPDQVSLTWTNVPNAELYRVFRSSFGCQDWGVKIAETTQLEWIDELIRSNWPYQYHVEAVFGDGIQVSSPSNCIMIGPEPPPIYHSHYFPMITR
jgi:hypothetical protein